MRVGAFPAGGTALGAALACACTIADGEWFGRIPDPDPTHFRWCNSGEPEWIDPALATSTTDLPIVYELFDGLTQSDDQGLPVPSLAESWEISPDQRRFVFHLRRDARWSNGRPITSEDFAWSLMRVLHPTTASRNAEALWRLRHGKAFNAGKAKKVLRDTPPFRAGDVVEVIEAGAPDTNARRARMALHLREAPDPASEAYATVPAGEEVTLVDLSPDAAWAWVYYGAGNTWYGWVETAALETPHVDRPIEVASLTDPPSSRRRGRVLGRDLLMVPAILGIETPDPYTLVLETEGPTPYLLNLTLDRTMRPTPREVVSRWPKSWTRPGRIVTSGPFHLAEWRQRDKLVLVRSPTFWGKDEVRLEKVTIFSINDQTANASLYYQGGCDAMVPAAVPGTYRPVLAGEAGPRRAPKKDYKRAPYLGIYFYAINTRRFPNVHFRRALSHAVDRTRLPLLTKGGEIPAQQFTPGKRIAEMNDEELALCGVTRDTPGVALIVEAGKLCYVPPLGPAFDLAKAREELERARREMGPAFPKKITIRFNTGVEMHKHIAELLQHEWEKHLGLRVELESQEWKIFLKDTASGHYDVARFGAIGNFPDPEAEFLTFLRCDSPDNLTGWCHPEYERLYDEATREPDRRKRLDLLRRAEAIMIEEAPVIPLYVYTQHHLQKPYVRGLAINLTGRTNLRRVWIDPAWREKEGR